MLRQGIAGEAWPKMHDQQAELTVARKCMPWQGLVDTAGAGETGGGCAAWRVSAEMKIITWDRVKTGRQLEAEDDLRTLGLRSAGGEAPTM
jgi:hypothetical protein